MLEPLDRSEQSKALEYSDLYLQVGPKLIEAGHYQYALTFYQSLKRYPDLRTPAFYIGMGKCFQGIGFGFKAEDCFQMAIKMDDDNVDARMELATMYEQLGEQEQAFIYVNEVMSIKRAQNFKLRPGLKPSEKRARIDGPLPEPDTPKSELALMPTRVPRTYKPRRLAEPAEKLKDEAARTEQLQSQYHTMRNAHKGMRNGDLQATNEWLGAARDLTDDFRGFKPFYPWEKYVKFLGYTCGSRASAEIPLDSNLTAMAERLSQSSLHPKLSNKDMY